MRQHKLLAGEEAPRSEITDFQSVAPYEGAEANVLPVSLFGRVNLDATLEEGETMVWLQNGPSVRVCA